MADVRCPSCRNPVSGRWWKPVQAKRSSAVIRKPKTNRKQAAWKARKGREREMKVRWPHMAESYADMPCHG